MEESKNNYSISQNEKLYYLRKEKNITLKEASKGMHINILKLFNLERGYWKFSDKIISKISKFYNIDENEFKNLNQVPIQINDKKIKSKNRTINKILSNKLTAIISLLIAILLIIFAPISYNNRQKMIQTPENYMSESYLNLYDKIINKTTICDKHSEPSLIFLDDFFLTRTDYSYYMDQVIIEKDGYKLRSDFLVPITHSKMHLFSISNRVILDNDEELLIYFSYRGGHNKNLRGEIIYSVGLSETAIRDLYFVKNKGIQIDYKNEDIDNLLKENYNKYKDEIFEPINKYIFDNTNMDTSDFINESLNYISKYSSKTVMLFYLYLISSILSVLFISLSITSFAVIMKKKYKYDINEFLISTKPDKSSITTNKWPSLFIKEGYLKIVGITLLFLANYAFVMTISTFLGNFELGLNADFLAFLFKIPKFTQIGAMILIVITCQNYMEDREVYKKAFIFLIVGIIYYFIELFIIRRVIESSILINEIMAFVPANFFLSIAILLFITMFLFQTPRNLEHSKKLILYRLCSLLPIIFFIITYTLKVLRSKGLITIPIEILYLFPHKLLGVEFFGILFIFIMYIFELIIRKKHGREYLEQYKNTNKFYLIQNIIICSLLLLVSILENNSFLKSQLSTLGVGKLSYTYIIIPFFLFYHPRIERPNPKQGILYLCGIIMTFVVPYVILAFEFIKFLNL